LGRLRWGAMRASVNQQVPEGAVRGRGPGVLCLKVDHE
jgi:hypothetical protein